MSYPHETAATAILDHLHQAEKGLEKHEVILTDGVRGIVHHVKLDSHHGLAFTFDTLQPDYWGDDRCQWFPVSRIREVVP